MIVKLETYVEIDENKYKSLSKKEITALVERVIDYGHVSDMIKEIANGDISQANFEKENPNF